MGPLIGWCNRFGRIEVELAAPAVTERAHARRAAAWAELAAISHSPNRREDRISPRRRRSTWPARSRDRRQREVGLLGERDLGEYLPVADQDLALVVAVNGPYSVRVTTKDREHWVPRISRAQGPAKPLR